MISRSSKVIDLGANRKPICDLLLVIDSNFRHICYRTVFEIFTVKDRQALLAAISIFDQCIVIVAP